MFFIDINPPVISIVGFTSHGFMSAIFSTPLKIPAILIIHLVTNKRLGKNNLEPGMNKSSLYTLPETNIAPENRPSQKETCIPTIHFSGAMLVSGRVTVLHKYLYFIQLCAKIHIFQPRKAPASVVGAPHAADFGHRERFLVRPGHFGSLGWAQGNPTVKLNQFCPESCHGNIFIKENKQ